MSSAVSSCIIFSWRCAVGFFNVRNRWWLSLITLREKIKQLGVPAARHGQRDWVGPCFYKRPGGGQPSVVRRSAYVPIVFWPKAMFEFLARGFSAAPVAPRWCFFAPLSVRVQRPDPSENWESW